MAFRVFLLVVIDETDYFKEVVAEENDENDDVGNIFDILLDF